MILTTIISKVKFIAINGILSACIAPEKMSGKKLKTIKRLNRVKIDNLLNSSL